MSNEKKEMQIAYKKACENFEATYRNYRLAEYAKHELASVPGFDVGKHLELHKDMERKYSLFDKDAWHEVERIWFSYETLLKGKELYKQTATMADYEHKVDFERYKFEQNKEDKKDRLESVRYDEVKRNNALMSLNYIEQRNSTIAFFVTASFTGLAARSPSLKKVTELKIIPHN
jgi:hypothetical protein